MDNLLQKPSFSHAKEQQKAFKLLYVRLLYALMYLTLKGKIFDPRLTIFPRALIHGIKLPNSPRYSRYEAAGFNKKIVV
jgi:hypothetical protein